MTHCKNCNSNNIQQLLGDEVVTYKGEELPLALHYSLCANCGREFVPREQILINDALVREAKKAADGLLLSVEIRTMRKKLGLTQHQAGEMFGGGPNAFSKYERGEVTQSVAMDKLLRIVSGSSAARQLLLHISGVLQEEVYDGAWETINEGTVWVTTEKKELHFEVESEWYSSERAA